MSERQRSPTARLQAPSPDRLARRSANPVQALQGAIGNRAVGQVLARAPVTTGTVEFGDLGPIRVRGGNLEEWAGKGAPDTVELTSEKGEHSAKLQRLSTDRTRADVKVKIDPATKTGQQLDMGGTLLEIKDARIKSYAVNKGVETWRIGDFEQVKRTKITRKVR